MKWIKLGQIFIVNNANPYLLSHASNPLPYQINDSCFRIFYCGRDLNNRSSVGYVDFNIKKRSLISYPKNPIFIYGGKNSFYSHGVSLGNIYTDKYEQNKWLLFMGWKIRPNEHWHGVIGRLLLINNENLILNPRNPFLALDQEDPISLSYPFVIYHQGGFKMWYGSTITWDAGNNEMIHVIKYATSCDGINWNKKGIAIPFEINIAQAFSRPTVIIDTSGYKMWYSYRKGDGTKYRIGYAESKDGINWIRKDGEVGIDVSASGWDSEMICYPFVFDYEGNRYMLYNGNGYGKTGFGLAILEQD